jgi:hypothetical protein
MSWHYLAEQEGESLVDICSGGEQLQPLRSKTTHAVFYSNGKLMESYLDSLYGTMLQPSTENRGEEKLTSSPEDSPAKTLVPQGKAKGSTESAQASGPKWPESLAKYDPITSSWKTHQFSLLGDLEEFSATWPRWGMMQNGECWERTTPELPTSETESGFWPTPTAQQAGIINGLVTKDGEPAKQGKRAYNPKTGKHTQVTLNRYVAMWPTPLKSDYKRRGPNSKQQGLPEVVRDKEGVCGQLSPDWVEWLMGWPIGWTDLNQLEMVKFRQWSDSQ